jgi:hypothetical protein
MATNEEFAAKVANDLLNTLNSGAAVWDEAGGGHLAMDRIGDTWHVDLEEAEGAKCTVSVYFVRSGI